MFELKTQSINENEIDENEEESENNLRPEINGEYELELNNDKCLFKTQKLINKINNSEHTELLYLFKMIRSDEINHKQEKKDFEKRCEIFKNYSKNGIIFLCRLYLLNISNILFDDLRGKKGMFRIKNFGNYSQYKSDKEFDMVPGEINEIVTLNLKWPVNEKNFL